MTDDYDIGKPEREVRSTQKNLLTSGLSMTQLPDTALQSNDQFPMDSCQTHHQLDKASRNTASFYEKLIVTQCEELAKLKGLTEGP